MDKAILKPVIESLIFASEGAITLSNIMSVIEGAERAEVKAAVNELIEEYRGRGGGLFIEEVAGGYQFRTNPDFSPWLKRLLKIGPQRLSRAALETLAIVAYKQPVTRGELEAVRGVDSAGVLATLLDRRLIKITGRKETPGRPVVYGTTKEFLETFELKDLSSLPTLKEIEIPEEEYAPEEERKGEEASSQAEGGTEGGEDEGG
ncbi:MAG TPA: SMC-Scp complex subunit ScpB, partial [Thermodesulfobacteriota bacterium]|nr:SMC-Scp complex subunit ScpB [Thermodesulfobacteriota bacterium]